MEYIQEDGTHFGDFSPTPLCPPLRFLFFFSKASRRWGLRVRFPIRSTLSLRLLPFTSIFGVFPSLFPPGMRSARAAPLFLHLICPFFIPRFHKFFLAVEWTVFFFLAMLALSQIRGCLLDATGLVLFLCPHSAKFFSVLLPPFDEEHPNWLDSQLSPRRPPPGSIQFVLPMLETVCPPPSWRSLPPPDDDNCHSFQEKAWRFARVGPFVDCAFPFLSPEISPNRIEPDTGIPPFNRLVVTKLFGNTLFA